MYGLPNIANKRLQEQLSSGKVVLGGCCMDPGASPSHHCNECDHEWLVPPKADGFPDISLPNDDGAADRRRSVAVREASD